MVGLFKGSLLFALECGAQHSVMKQKHPPTLSIDFGASYTKVARRGMCVLAHCPDRYDEDAQLLLLEGSALIPTLAIHTGERKRPWIFGADAANLVPDQKMTVHSNWKAGLFNRSNSPGTARSTIIAAEFFRWLREKVEASGMRIDEHVVRIMLPAFRDFEDLAGVARECMKLAGWRPLDLIMATEPHANALGLLTNGRNRYSRGTRYEGIDFVEMYGTNNPYFQAVRNAALFDHASREFELGIVDIGAFTTDVAVLTFDVSALAEGDGLRHVRQESFELGTHDHLDAPFWERLGKRYDAQFGSLSFRVAEEVKMALFRGETYALIIGGKRRIIGDEEDQAIVNGVCSDFARAIAKKISADLAHGHGLRLFLSGGGSQVEPLVQALVDNGLHFTPVQGGQIESLDGEEVPQFRLWRTTGQHPTRIATALGGCSLLAPVALSSAPLIKLRSGHRKSLKTESPDSFRSCSCGGNPDCPRCKGSGYVNSSLSTA